MSKIKFRFAKAGGQKKKSVKYEAGMSRFSVYFAVKFGQS